LNLNLFLHSHPYKPFLFEEATRWIVGTLPPPRFTTGRLKPGDVDFCYGSRDGYLWPILDEIFGLSLRFEDSREAVWQRMDFLKARKIGICDIVESAEREKMDASDLGMRQVKLRDLVAFLYSYPSVHTLLFTGGSSRNGPEYFFRQLLKQYGIRLKRRNTQIPREHEFVLPDRNPPSRIRVTPAGRIIKTVSLTAPSGTANRAVGSMEAFKEIKRRNPSFTTLDFRIQQYRAYF
jgi:G:T/U-mismatch repair DNA glycosylase